jgi:acyl-coenzyme A synthetase/AMP-(fatty) acid ligase
MVIMNAVVKTIFRPIPVYIYGRWMLQDEDGFYRITGRVDDVLNVSGHRIGTAEVENAINMHAGVWKAQWLVFRMISRDRVFMLL